MYFPTKYLRPCPQNHPQNPILGDLSMQNLLYTVSQKVSHLMFDNNFGNCGPFSKFFHQVIREKIIYVDITNISTSPAICCYTTLWKSKIHKCYWLWQHLNRLLTCSWGHFEDFWFWSLSDDFSNQQVNLIQLNIIASWQFFRHDYRRTAFVLSRLYFVFCTHI